MDVSLDQSSYSVSEGAGVASVCVSLTGPSLATSLPITVEAVQTGSATGVLLFTVSTLFA